MPDDLRYTRILVVSDLVAATQRISFAQPLAPVLGKGLVFQAKGLEPAKIKPRFEAAAPELLVLSRLTMDEGQIWIDLARAAGVPVLYHIDDDLLAVPLALGREKYEAYNSPQRLAALRANMEGADLVYVSTAPLAEAVTAHGIATPIVAGDVYCSIEPAALKKAAPPSDLPVIGYMGTAGHAADLAEILPVVEELLHQVPTLQFELFGGLPIPPELQRFGHRARVVTPEADYAAFLAKMQRLGWWVGLAPLQDTAFNRCKADTKWVEYSLAGTAVVAADLPVYHRACADGCGILARDLRDWRQGIEALLFDEGRRRAMIAAARSKLATDYTHARLRAQIGEILARIAPVAEAA